MNDRHLRAARDQIERFVEPLFRYAAEGTYVSLRSFQHRQGEKPARIEAVKLNGQGLGTMVIAAERHATWAANHREPLVFAPPVATFTNEAHAAEADLAQGLALSVEIDERPTEAVQTLVTTLGVPTVIMASGGTWTDPTTGEVQKKLHVHYRLAEPTSTPAEHAKLKTARRLAVRLVAADPTTITTVHPLRWAGSWHLKDPAHPRLARVGGGDPEAEIGLDEALRLLEEACRRSGLDPEIDPAAATAAGSGRQETRDTGELIRRITTGAEYLAPMVALSARYAAAGMSRRQIVETLRGFLEGVPDAVRDLKDGKPIRGRWQDRWDSVERMAASASAKFGPKPPEPAPEPADGGSDWPDPIDILADPTLTGVATVDESCLPRSMFALSAAEARRLQVDPSGIAALTVGATSAAIPDAWRVRLKINDKGWIERPCVWTAVIAESGRKKTDQMRIATRGIAKIEQKIHAEHAKEMARYMEDHDAWSGLPKKERGPEPKPPAEVRIATDDFTVEVLSDLLQTSQKMLLRSDELATVLGAYDRYQRSGTINAGRAHMLALYDGGPRRIDRVMRGKVHVPNWSAVPVGHIQPAKVRDLVGNLSDDGLLQRFMLVMPPRAAPGDPDADDIATDWTAVDRFARIVERLFNMKPPETMGPDGRPEFAIVEAEPSAHRVRRRLFRLIERIEADPMLPAALKEAASKWRGLLARLSLVFHCIQLAEAKLEGKQLDPAAMLTLRTPTVEMACRFILRIVVPSTFQFHAEIGTSGPSETHARWVAGYILSRGLSSITARDVGRAYREIRGNTAEIRSTMDTLDHAGWVIPDEERPRGAAWTINPKIHALFKERAAAEKKRRDTVRELLKVSIAELAR
jgi:hypothetical protein